MHCGLGFRVVNPESLEFMNATMLVSKLVGFPVRNRMLVSNLVRTGRGGTSKQTSEDGGPMAAGLGLSGQEPGQRPGRGREDPGCGAS